MQFSWIIILLFNSNNIYYVYVIEDVYPEHMDNNEYPASFLSQFEHIDLSKQNGRGEHRLFVYRK